MLAADSEKPSDASRRRRRARAMASTKVRRWLVVPSGPALGHGVMFLQAVGGQGVQQKSPSSAGAAREMARPDHWRWVSTPRWVRTSWKVASGCQRNTNHCENLGRVRRRAGAQQGLGSEGLLRVADQYPADEHRRLAGAVPQRRLGGEFHGAAGAVVPGHLSAGPVERGLVEQWFQRRAAVGLSAAAAVLTQLTGRRRRIEGGVQTQSGDEGYRFTEGLTAVEQVQHGIAIVSHQHQRALGQPATQLQNHLPRQPVIFLRRRPCCW